MFTLRNIRLQYLFNSETDELSKSFKDLKKQTDDKTFKQELMIAFWLACYLKKVEAAKILVTIDPIVEEIILNLRENGLVWNRYKA